MPAGRGRLPRRIPGPAQPARRLQRGQGSLARAPQLRTLGYAGTGTLTPNVGSIPLNAPRVCGPYVADYDVGNSITSLYAALSVAASGSTQPCRMLVYADSGGLPGALVRTSGEVTVPIGSGQAWFEFPITAWTPTPGASYWIGIFAGATTGQLRVYFDTVTNALQEATGGTYPTPPDPFGSISQTLSQRMLMYAAYVPYTPAPALGGNVDGGTATGDLYVDGATASAAASASATGDLYTDGSHAASASGAATGDLYVDGGQAASASGAATGDLYVDGSGTATASKAATGDLYADGSASASASGAATGDLYVDGSAAASASGSAAGELYVDGSHAALVQAPATTGDLYADGSGAAALAPGGATGELYADGSGTAAASAAAAGDLYTDGDADVAATAAATGSLYVDAPEATEYVVTAVGSLYVDGDGAATATAGGNGDLYADGDYAAAASTSATGELYADGSHAAAAEAEATGEVYADGSHGAAVAAAGAGELYVDGEQEAEAQYPPGELYVDATGEAAVVAAQAGELYVDGSGAAAVPVYAESTGELLLDADATWELHEPPAVTPGGLPGEPGPRRRLPKPRREPRRPVQPLRRLPVVREGAGTLVLAAEAEHQLYGNTYDELGVLLHVLA